MDSQVLKARPRSYDEVAAVYERYDIMEGGVLLGQNINSDSRNNIAAQKQPPQQQPVPPQAPPMSPQSPSKGTGGRRQSLLAKGKGSSSSSFPSAFESSIQLESAGGGGALGQAAGGAPSASGGGVAKPPMSAGRMTTPGSTDGGEAQLHRKSTQALLNVSHEVAIDPWHPRFTADLYKTSDLERQKTASEHTERRYVSEGKMVLTIDANGIKVPVAQFA
jgi:hypothetical protein